MTLDEWQSKGTHLHTWVKTRDQHFLSLLLSFCTLKTLTVPDIMWMFSHFSAAIMFFYVAVNASRQISKAAYETVIIIQIQMTVVKYLSTYHLSIYLENQLPLDSEGTEVTYCIFSLAYRKKTNPCSCVFLQKHDALQSSGRDHVIPKEVEWDSLTFTHVNTSNIPWFSVLSKVTFEKWRLLLRQIYPIKNQKSEWH